MVCFPGTPQLKINSRNFKILRLLGEVSKRTTEPASAALLTLLSGRLFLRLPRPRQCEPAALRAEKDPMSVRPGIRLAGPQRSRGLLALLAAPEHHPLDRLQRRFGQVRPQRKDRVHPPAVLPPRKPAGHDQCESGQPHTIPGEEAHAIVLRRVQGAQDDASVPGERRPGRYKERGQSEESKERRRARGR